MPRLTELERLEILARYQFGESILDLAKAYSVDRSAVGTLLIRRGVRVASYKRNFLSEDQKSESVNRFSEGETFSEIARSYNVSHQTVRRFLIDCGVHLSMDRKPSISPNQKQEFIDRYVRGEKLNDLSSEFGLIYQNAWKMLKNSGVFSVRPLSINDRRFLNIDDSAFKNLSSEEVLYWCGFIFADGCVNFKTKGSPELQVSLAEYDLSHLEKLRTFLSSDHKIGFVENFPSVDSKAARRATYKVRSKDICTDLVSYGRYSNDLNRALFSSRHFWRGLVDGDGSMGVSKNRSGVYPVFSVVGRYYIVDRFRDRFILTGTPSRASVVSCGSIFRYCLTGQYAVDCINWLYHDNTIALDRKNKTAQRILREYG